MEEFLGFYNNLKNAASWKSHGSDNWLGAEEVQRYQGGSIFKEFRFAADILNLLFKSGPKMSNRATIRKPGNLNEQRQDNITRLHTNKLEIIRRILDMFFVFRI